MKDDAMKKIMWKPEEDMLLKTYVEIHGEGNWFAVPRKLGLRRGGKSCRLRWRNYLRPDIKHGSMSKDEEDLIIRMHKLIGNRWALIAGRLPGRTDNEVKNYWNTYLGKKAPKRRAKIKSSTQNTNVDDEKRAKIGHGSSQEEVINTNTVDVVKEEKLNNKHGESKELDDGKYWITSEDITGEIVVGSGSRSGAGILSCGIMDMHFMDMNYDNQFTIFGGEMDGHGLWDHGNCLLLDTFESKWEDTPLPLP